MNLIPKALTAPLDAAPPMLPYALGDQWIQPEQTQSLDVPSEPIAKMPMGGDLIQKAAQTLPPIDPQQQMIDHDTQQLQKVQWKQAHPWGTAENHPGTFGKIAHVLSVAGNIAGNIVAPNVMAGIPGTQANLQEEQGGLAKRLSGEVTEQGLDKEHAATTAKTELDTSLEPGKTQSLEDYQSAETKKINDEIQQGPSLAAGYAHAVNQALKEGRDPATDPVVQHLSDAITSIQKQSAAADKGEHVNLMDAKGHPYAATYDPGKKQYFDAQGKPVTNPIPYEKPININTGTAALDRETARFAKPYEKAVSDANTQLDKIADARAMINGSAESQALGVPKVLTALVSGAGSGVRITQPELNAIATARGLSGNIEGTINAWSGQGKLTATQKQQLTGILDDVKARILAKQQIHNEALDKINSAPSREAVLETEKGVRKQLHDLEQGGGGAKEGDTKVNGAGIKVKFSGGKWGPA